jgi:hypothetical protein
VFGTSSPRFVLHVRRLSFVFSLTLVLLAVALAIDGATDWWLLPAAGLAVLVTADFQRGRSATSGLRFRRQAGGARFNEARALAGPIPPVPPNGGRRQGTTRDPHTVENGEWAAFWFRGHAPERVRSERSGRRAPPPATCARALCR